MREKLNHILSLIENPRLGLPQQVFYFISQLTPLVNVDLLIKNEQGQTLLTWRDDGFYGPGWHIPGGILRFKETAENRIKKVAAEELGISVKADIKPLAINEKIAKNRDVRGHFIALLYACQLTSELPLETQASAENIKAGQWQWHDGCPDNLIEQHNVYRPFIE